MAAEDPARAARELRQAADLAPNVARVWCALGEALYAAGDAGGAAEALDKAIRFDPADLGSLYLRGRVALGLGRPDEAVAFLGELLQRGSAGSPYVILSQYYMARTYQGTGDVDGALAHYEALLDQIRQPQSFFRRYPEICLLYQGRAQLMQSVGQLCLLRGDNDRAIAYLKEALAERPQHTVILRLLCRAYIQKKDFAVARLWARKLIEVHPDGPAGYQRLVETYRAEGKMEAAVAELETFRHNDPENRTLAFELAELYEAVGRSDQAADILAELAQQAGLPPAAAAEAALKLADLHYRAGRPLETLAALADAMTGSRSDLAIVLRATQIIDRLEDPDSLYEKAGKLVTDEVPSYGPFVIVGMLAERIGRIEDAIALYDKALAREPKAPVAYAQKADLLIRADRLEDALAVYRSAVAAGLRFPVFYRRMGMILERLDRLDEAVGQYRLARQGDPYDKAARYLLAGALARQGKYPEAEAELKGLIEQFPTEVPAFCELAVLYLAQDDLVQAERAVQQAQALDAEAIPPQVLLVEIRYRQKQFPEAENLARRILNDHPDAHQAQVLLAHALAAQNRYAEAVAEVQSLLTGDPENAGWRYLLAGLYNEMGKEDSAEDELARILQTEPDYAPANNDLGYIWADRGVNLDRAERMIRLALEADPQRPAYMDSLGWVLYKRGRFEEAVRLLEAAAEKAPDLDSVIWDHLGDTYWRLSRPEKAGEAWQKAAHVLEADAFRSRPEELQRLRQKIESLRAGSAPPVAPTAEREPADSQEPVSPSPSSEP